jgi:hypothetical protein
LRPPRVGCRPQTPHHACRCSASVAQHRVRLSFQPRLVRALKLHFAGWCVCAGGCWRHPRHSCSSDVSEQRARERALPPFLTHAPGGNMNTRPHRMPHGPFVHSMRLVVCICPRKVSCWYICVQVMGSLFLCYKRPFLTHPPHFPVPSNLWRCGPQCANTLHEACYIVGVACSRLSLSRRNREGKGGGCKAGGGLAVALVTRWQLPDGTNRALMPCGLQVVAAACIVCSLGLGGRRRH